MPQWKMENKEVETVFRPMHWCTEVIIIVKQLQQEDYYDEEYAITVA